MKKPIMKRMSFWPLEERVGQGNGEAWRALAVALVVGSLLSGCGSVPAAPRGAQATGTASASLSAKALEEVFYGEWYDATTLLLPPPPRARVEQR
jgi:uncharacterized protein YceK